MTRGLDKFLNPRISSLLTLVYICVQTWTMLWYVLQENKWMLLPEETCRMLTDAGNVERVSDEQHLYNLKIFKRASKEDGKSEEIMFVKGNYLVLYQRL